MPRPSPTVGVLPVFGCTTADFAHRQPGTLRSLSTNALAEAHAVGRRAREQHRIG